MLSKAEKRTEQLKDRRDYRNALINRSNVIEAKISQVDEQIKKIEKE